MTECPKLDRSSNTERGYSFDVPTSDPTLMLTRGHKKKARTRQLLLDTATDVLAEQGEGFSVTDIASRAGVSHGTFYNYFSDGDELVEALVPHIISRFAERMAVEVTDTDPAARIARITANGFEMAIREPHSVRVALRIDAVQRGLIAAGPLAHFGQDLLDGYASGRFIGSVDDGTVDLVLGGLLFSARRIIDGEHSADYRISILQRVLEALGIDAEEATTLASDAVAATADGTPPAATNSRQPPR
jgi:AcrR family transcriptional regulator